MHLKCSDSYLLMNYSEPVTMCVHKLDLGSRTHVNCPRSQETG